METINKFKLPEDSEFVDYYNESVETTNLPREGNYVYTSKMESLLLGRIIGSGGEGSIYEIDEVTVAKVFNSKRLTKGRQEKIELMTSKHIKIAGVCFPVETIYNKEGISIGYTMNKAFGTNLVNLLQQEEVFKVRYPSYMKIDIVKICISILEKISLLHRYNVILVDINLSNIMFESSNEIYILDTDSFQIEGYPGLVGRKEFFPLEIRYTDFRKKLKGFEYDYYTVVVLLFYLLMNGVHPYQSLGNKIEENRDKGYFPYRVDESESMTKVPNETSLKTWISLPKPIKEMFFNTFNKDSKRYHPKNRASIELWLKHLYRYMDALVDGTLETLMGQNVLEVFPK